MVCPYELALEGWNIYILAINALYQPFNIEICSVASYRVFKCKRLILSVFDRYRFSLNHCDHPIILVYWLVAKIHATFA
jgi:hypothetical protein